MEFILGHYNHWVVIFLMMAGLYVVVSRGNLVKKIVGLKNDANVGRMKEANKLKVRQHYSWDAIGAKITEMYEEALSRRQNGHK